MRFKKEPRPIRAFGRSLHRNPLARAAIYENLTKAIREVEAILQTMRAEHDPLASHIFVSRRRYQSLSDTKSGKRRAMSAQLSWQTACELGFRGNLAEWERLMGAVARQ